MSESSDVRQSDRDQNRNSSSHGGRNSSNPFDLSNSDSPGSQIITLQFTGNNFLNWSKSVYMALGAKQKLGFIDGKCTRPPIISENYEAWVRADYMVRCWLLNSMVQIIADSLWYVTSARHLWTTVSERYGHSNEPLVYQLQRELHVVVQANMSVVEYFSKLKVLWEDLQNFESFPDWSCGALSNCTCNLLKKVLDNQNRDQLISFLMGLGDQFETVRASIMATDPLPSVNKAFHLVQQAERQKEITMSVSSQNPMDSSALAASRQYGGDKKDYKKDKKDRFCSHCRLKN